MVQRGEGMAQRVGEEGAGRILNIVINGLLND